MALHSRPNHTDAAPGAISAFLIGTVLGMLVVGGFIGGVTYLVGGDLAAGLVVGAFCAFWGGPGFGGMMGFIVHQDRAAKRQAVLDPAAVSPAVGQLVSSTSG